MAAMMQPRKEKSGLLARFVPIFQWLPHYQKAWLSGDIVAGLSVAKAGSGEAIALVAAITILASWIASLPQTNTTTLIVGVVALAILVVLKIYAPRVPGALVILVLGIGASAISNLSVQWFTQKEKPTAKNDL
jgi:MFS superfamily sulfate permease-like transporter